MSRKSQDIHIPIRPRFGIPEDAPSDDDEKLTTKTRKTSACSNTEQMASSYSEIPFLAQYPGPVPDHVLNDATPTAVKPRDSLDEEEDSADDVNTSGEDEDASKTPKRPHSLQYDSSFPYELEGGATSTTEGEMRHFVAENLEQKLRSDRKADQFGFASHNSTPSTSTTGMLTRHFLQTQVPQLDSNVLSDIEIEAQYLAASVDNLTENLCNLLHSISSITADNVEVHKNAVNKLTDSMDANIKCMYTIMCKTEEISKSMLPTEKLGQRIREIKRLVDMLDNTM